MNRDILKILSDQNKYNNPKNHIFYQIITRLTSINNQAMINTANLIHEKNVIKQEVCWIFI